MSATPESTDPTSQPAPGSEPSGGRFLEGRVALVTGASRGIGRAIAERLAERGARVACIATRAENCAATVEACGDGARAFGVDVSDTDEVAAVVKAVQENLGGLDILVNNAGVTRDQILLRMSEEDFDRVVAVNLKGSWNFIRAAARPLMKSRGRIVNVSSVVGLTGNAGQANYAASKAGVIGLTKSVAKELASRGVCVNAVAPGFIETDMTADLPEAAAAELAASIPLKRIGTPAEVAHVVDYLVSPGGAYVTGQTIVVDGGLSL
ncbi:MAG TPA: 3-oxoacyl-[acyl-carrier-protein] reductase [Planctomycetes bacterium]|nr:3-oxoacyl-[acyl-carrier-protein] reductase [Planctomycetota bacterium]